MKINVYYPSSIWSAWNMSHGITAALRRMGHDVTDCPIEAGTNTIRRSQYPSAEQLEQSDCFLVAGPEHIGKYLFALYQNWRELKVQKLAWWHEPLHRVENADEVLKICDVNFSASEEDRGKCEYLPYGVDREIFHPAPFHPDIDLAFIGLMYPKRAQFMAKIPADIRERMKVGNCTVQDLDGVNIRKSAELYADTLRRIKTLVVLPSLSRVVVTKVYEGWACGCNVAILHEDMDEKQIRYEIEHPHFDHNDHSLESRLNVLLSKVKA